MRRLPGHNITSPGQDLARWHVLESYSRVLESYSRVLEFDFFVLEFDFFVLEFDFFVLESYSRVLEFDFFVLSTQEIRNASGRILKTGESCQFHAMCY